MKVPDYLLRISKIEQKSKSKLIVQKQFDLNGLSEQ